MNRKIVLALSLIMAFASLSIVGCTPKVLGQSGTKVSSQIITQDTTWTQAGSPYTLDGPVGIAQGATLTIAPGVTVNLGAFYLEVNGTLDAKGTTANQIFFYSNSQITGPPFTYNDLSSAPDNIFMLYDNPTCDVENAVLNQTSISADSYVSNATVTVIDCQLRGDSEIAVSGSAVICGNTVEGAVLLRGASTITNNTLFAGINIAGGQFSPAVVGTYSVTGNNITNQQGNDVVWCGDSGTIKDNVIWGGSEAGICRDDYPTGTTLIESNLIIKNADGILLERTDDNATIQDNTIAYNQVGIKAPTNSETLTGNNFEDNTQYNVQAGSDSVNAQNNWWGTTSQSAISQSIYDSKNDFNLGTVTFVPFLTAPNPQAPSINSTIATPTQNSTPSPTPKSTLTSPNPTLASHNPVTGTQTKAGAGVNWTQIALVTAVVVIAVLAVAVVALARRSYGKGEK